RTTSSTSPVPRRCPTAQPVPVDRAFLTSHLKNFAWIGSLKLAFGRDRNVQLFRAVFARAPCIVRPIHRRSTAGRIQRDNRPTPALETPRCRALVRAGPLDPRPSTSPCRGPQ